MNPASDWRPASSNERVQTIDIIRGLALFGVLIVNILSDFRVPLLEHILGLSPSLGEPIAWSNS